jgi:hypothetical protein
LDGLAVSGKRAAGHAEYRSARRGRHAFHGRLCGRTRWLADACRHSHRAVTGEIAHHDSYPNYAFHSQNRLGGAIRKESYKLIENFDDGSLELYDLKDPTKPANHPPPIPKE